MKPSGPGSQAARRALSFPVFLLLAGLAAPPPASGQASPEERSVGVRYLHHSGWLVDTGGHVLLFDYIGGAGPDSAPGTGWIRPADLHGRSVISFVSHRHADHWAPSLVTGPGALDDATLVLGWEPDPPVEAVRMGPRETRPVGAATVTTIASTDLGVGFLVEIDGVTLFHAGDHALWEPASRAAYVGEIDWLAERNPRIDVAFLPIATGMTCDPRPSIRDGAAVAIEKLDPQVVFPMHVRCVEGLERYADFAAAMRERFPDLTVHAPARPGQTYRVPVRADATSGP